MSLLILFLFGWLLNKKAARVEVNISLAFLHWVGIALHPWPFVSDIAIFVLKGDVELNELTLYQSASIQFIYCCRLTPVYMILLGIWASLFVYIGDGPLWPYVGPIHTQMENCKYNWWTNLLYVNNFVYPTEQVECLSLCLIDWVKVLPQGQHSPTNV